MGRVALINPRRPTALSTARLILFGAMFRDLETSRIHLALRLPTRSSAARRIGAILAVMLLAACGGSSQQQTSQIAAGIRSNLVGQTLNSPAWETVTVRDLRLGPIKPPPDKAMRATVSAAGKETLGVTFAPTAFAPGSSVINHQLVVSPGGTTLEEPATVTATVAKNAHGDWAVVSADSRAPSEGPGLTFASDPALPKTTLAAVRILFTYSGNRSAYAQAQRSFYAITLDPPTLDIPSSGDGGAFVGGAELGNLFTPNCPARGVDVGGTLLLPGHMQVRDLRLTDVQALYDIPPAVQETGKVTILSSGWTSMDRAGGTATLPCQSVTTVLSFHAGMVRSLISGRWLVGDLELEQPGNPLGVLSHGTVIQGLGSMSVTPPSS